MLNIWSAHTPARAVTTDSNSVVIGFVNVKVKQVLQKLVK